MMTWLASLLLSVSLVLGGPLVKEGGPSEVPVRVRVDALPGPTVTAGTWLVVEAQLDAPDAVDVEIARVDLVLPDGGVIEMERSLADRGRWSCHLVVPARWGLGLHDLWVFAVDSNGGSSAGVVAIELVPATVATIGIIKPPRFDCLTGVAFAMAANEGHGLFSSEHDLADYVVL